NESVGKLFAIRAAIPNCCPYKGDSRDYVYRNINRRATCFATAAHAETDRLGVHLNARSRTTTRSSKWRSRGLTAGVVDSLYGGFSTANNQCLRRETHCSALKVSPRCIGNSLLYGW